MKAMVGHGSVWTNAASVSLPAAWSGFRAARTTAGPADDARLIAGFVYFGCHSNKFAIVICIVVACNWFHLTCRYPFHLGVSNAAFRPKTVGGQHMPNCVTLKSCWLRVHRSLLSENFVCLDLLLGTPEVTLVAERLTPFQLRTPTWNSTTTTSPTTLWITFTTFWTRSIVLALHRFYFLEYTSDLGLSICSASLLLGHLQCFSSTCTPAVLLFYLYSCSASPLPGLSWV